jgi:hypothetical protein
MSVLPYVAVCCKSCLCVCSEESLQSVLCKKWSFTTVHPTRKFCIRIVLAVTHVLCEAK